MPKIIKCIRILRKNYMLFISDISMGVEGRIPDFYSAMGREWGGAGINKLSNAIPQIIQSKIIRIPS